MSIVPPTLAHVIGRGTYGVVHAATSADGAPVAVKVVPATDSTTAADLEREIELMRGFAHPNIVGFVTAFATTGAEIWVVMELCACSLSSALRRGPLAAAAAGGAMHDALRGLAYLHVEQRTIHRDVKAANLLVAADGVVKLADFGVSAALETSTARTIIGTPHWMAPEVIAGAGYDARADVWSLGVTCYELLRARRRTTTWARRWR